jgi:BirA family biotin operon repressor/biotin-[acetyl-CoA-carboxylase] ligase
MTKQKVLALLKEQAGYLSGEAMSRELGVSRAAVNAAVKALRADGYTIASATNRGYCLTGEPDLLTQEAVGAYLPAARMTRVCCLDSVDSTNKRLKEMAEEGAPDGQIVLANEQTRGRGRLGREFASPRDSGIYLSMLLRPSVPLSDMVCVTARTAVAVGRAVERVCGVAPGIKWVNDLVMDGRKICGILTELSLEGESGMIPSVVIGIGVNVNEAEADFPEELRPVATSLSEQTGKAQPRAALAAAMIEELDAMAAGWQQNRQADLEAYRKASVTVGQAVTVIAPAGERFGLALDVGEDYALRVRYDDGTEADIQSGEVSVRGLYGYA